MRNLAIALSCLTLPSCATVPLSYAVAVNANPISRQPNEALVRDYGVDPYSLLQGREANACFNFIHAKKATQAPDKKMVYYVMGNSMCRLGIGDEGWITAIYDHRVDAKTVVSVSASLRGDEYGGTLALNRGDEVEHMVTVAGLLEDNGRRVSFIMPAIEGGWRPSDHDRDALVDMLYAVTKLGQLAGMLDDDMQLEAPSDPENTVIVPSGPEKFEI